MAYPMRDFEGAMRQFFQDLTNGTGHSRLMRQLLQVIRRSGLEIVLLESIQRI